MQLFWRISFYLPTLQEWNSAQSQWRSKEDLRLFVFGAKMPFNKTYKLWAKRSICLMSVKRVRNIERNLYGNLSLKELLKVFFFVPCQWANCEHPSFSPSVDNGRVSETVWHRPFMLNLLLILRQLIVE